MKAIKIKNHQINIKISNYRNKISKIYRRGNYYQMKVIKKSISITRHGLDLYLVQKFPLLFQLFFFYSHQLKFHLLSLIDRSDYTINKIQTSSLFIPLFYWLFILPLIL